MNNDLIAMIFPDEEDALEIRKALDMMRTSKFLGSINVVPITKDRQGNIIVHFRWQPQIDSRTPGDQMPVIVANAIFGKSSEEKMQQLIEAGLDELFLKKLQADLVPGSSMILGNISRDSLVDTQQFLDAISQFKGTVYQSTVPDEVEEAIIKNVVIE